ncbi:hypothetical protein AHAT_21670 [Agarivorans sp. Toyoura001]|uniref:hypothetical protein n=1 Tax=Agarivorans sp. Toyoura001 TaxID=2283141 RepID=UPI0010E6D1C7|nr:hypothetical protein [Agarivorans sp. Toyoura001]GDY26277.1 hypothetical protein AHAT_21670 [Agarivorans sp. Toyoura001]
MMKSKLESLPNSLSAFKEYAGEILEQYPSKEEENVLLIGNDVSVAPLFYKAIIWPPTSRHSIARYEQIHEIEIPIAIKELLAIANGIEVLSLRICGLSKSMLNDPPTLDRSVRPMCLDLHIQNKTNRKNGYFCFASSHWSSKENVNYFVTPEGDFVALLKNGKEVGRWDAPEPFLSDAISQAIEYDISHGEGNEKPWWKMW